MNRTSTNRIVVSALFVSIGIILPIAFHVFGGNLGKVLLPMHIPVLIAGFYLPVGYAAIVGFLTPLLSSLLTGMPPIFPVGVTMMLELATYAVAVSLLYLFLQSNKKLAKNNLHIYLTLVVSMLCGRIIAGVAFWIIADSTVNPFVYVATNITTGWIGIAVQLFVVPLVVMFIKRNESQQI